VRNKQLVTFKGKKNGITIFLDKEADFSELKSVFEHKITEAKSFFGSAKVPITFSGRVLTVEQKREMVEIIRSKTTIDVSGVRKSGNTINVTDIVSKTQNGGEAANSEAGLSAAEKESGKSAAEGQGNEPASETEQERTVFETVNVESEDESGFENTSIIFEDEPEPSAAAQEKQRLSDIISASYTTERNFTLFHTGSLRSGQKIEHGEGGLVIIGDVNPGAHVAARGSVVVLGALKGFVHAGSDGDEGCYVAALNLMPTQIRIADIITYIPPEMNVKGKRGEPSYAYVDKGRIFIARLQ
jgi:septum site-determining protein MinC